MINYKIFTFIVLLTFVAVTNRSLCSAEKPLGIITGVNDAIATVEFDSSVFLQPGTMVAMYGAGAVKLYPLTDEVAVRELEHIATGQVIGKGGNVLKVRCTWKKPDFEMEVGMSAVPLSDQAAPNSPPVQSGEIDDVSASIQSSMELTFPIKDPENDDVFYVWELIGEKGRVGSLESQITRIPENTWFTPAVENKARVTVTATDTYGQSLTCSMNLSTLMWDDSWRSRELSPFRILGSDLSGNSRFLMRDGKGYWLSLTDGAVFRISPGWSKSQQLLTDQTPSAMAVFNDLIHCVSDDSREVHVFDTKGALIRSYGIQNKPTDIVIRNDGVVFIADQSLGGIQVYEANGMFRCTLGRAGEGRENFSDLTRITLDRNANLYALDQNSSVIHRFNRFQERLSSWTLKLAAKEIAKDIAWHPKSGLLVLLNNGHLLRLDDEGRKSRQTTEPSINHQYAGDVGSSESLYVDTSGDIFVTYPMEGIIARYDEDINLYGIRGTPFWGLSRFALDATGGGCAIYGDSGTILAVDSEGWIIKQIGIPRKQTVSLKKLPKLAISPDGEMLVALDPESTQIVRFSLTDSSAPVVFGQLGTNDGQFQTLTDVVIDDYGHIYVLDSKLSRISVFDRNGRFIFGFGKKGKLKTELRRPSLLAVRPGGQTVYVCDGYEIKKFTIDFPKGRATHSSNAGGRGKGQGQLLNPLAMACDRQGLLYILDDDRRDLQVIDFRGPNAIGIYTRRYKDWGFQKISEMALNVDGQPYLMDSGRLVGLSWKE